MKRLLIPFAFFLAAATPVSANGLSSKLVHSVQLNVDNAITNSTRGASSYSLSTSGMTITDPGGLTAGTHGVADYSAPTLTQTTAGESSSFQISFTEADQVVSVNSGVDVDSTSGALTALPTFSNVISQAGGVSGDLAGTVNMGADGVTVTAGNSGTSVIGSISSEIKIGSW
mgnify:CR=1 FL=1